MAAAGAPDSASTPLACPSGSGSNSSQGSSRGGAGAGSAGSSANATNTGGSDKWYFSREQLANSPSRQCGLDADKELAFRQRAASLIQDMGQRLQVSQLCINTAIVYMHRFYAFHSFTQFHRNSMAAAALFLAAKVEEQPRKLEHVIKVSHICLHRGDSQTSLDTQSSRYIEQAQDLVFNENVLLQTLGFDVAIDHPHTHVVRTCNLIRATKDLAQTSYFMASNSLHLTTMCLQYRPTVVACFCIHLASKWSNWAIPQSNEGKHWFCYIDRTVTSELLEHLTSEFLRIFDRCPTARLKKKIMSISNSQGTNSPQQAGSSHSNIQNDKEPRKISMEDMEKAEAEKRQSLFGPSMSSNSSQMIPVSSKMDYREYKERQQQDRRRPPNMPPSNMVPRPQDVPGSSQHRQSSSSSQRPQNIPPSQNRWPPNHRSSKEVVSMRPHPSQSSSSSRPPHRSSSSVHPPQSSSSQSMQPIPEQKSRSHHPPQPSLSHMSRIHPHVPPQQMVQQAQQPQHQSHQPLAQTIQQNVPIPIQQPSPPPSSLFSPEPQRKPSAPRHPPAPIPSKELITMPAALLSPFSSSPPLITHPPVEIEPPSAMKIEEPPSIDIQPQPPPPPQIPSVVETDPTIISSLLKESLPHRADKKKKKDKHKHKDRHKQERRKHKKDKDKKRDSESSTAPPIPAITAPPPQNSIQSSTKPIKITIPRDAIANTTPPNPTKLKIKIPKERLRTEPPVPIQQQQQLPSLSSALKIKIPKEYVDSSKKRPSPAGMVMEGGQAHKIARMSQQAHPHHKVSQELLHGSSAGYINSYPPHMMMYHHNQPPPLLYQHHPPPPYFYPQQNVYSHPPPAPTVPPLPPLPPPPPPPPPP